jgi:outer membrane murein-binding lipoprotein Lpp
MATTVAAVVSVLGLAGCGAAADAATLSAEGQALAAMGFDVKDLAAETGDGVTGAPDASAAPDGRRRHKAGSGRVLLRRNVLHGEAVVQTDTGTKTVDVQRGTVTAIDATGLTVKSADGFTLTWKFGSPLHVIEHRTTVQASAVKVGTEIGIAGTRDGDTVSAHLILIPASK